MADEPGRDAAVPTPPLSRVLTQQDREQALQRFRLLQAGIDEDVPVARIARHVGVAVRTAQRWAQQYRAYGLAGLVRKKRADAGRRRLPADLHVLIEGLALRAPPPSVAAIHRQVTDLARQRGDPVPSYARVYDIVRALDPALISLAHDGAKAYGEKFDLVIRQEAQCPNAVWQADHTLLDLWVRDERDRPVRPWLTVILDDHSRAVAGYALSLDAPSALQTALALRQAIWRKEDASWHVQGIPGRFYTDHGSDFTSRHLEQVAADLRIHLVFSLPGAPRGRGKIERFFATVNQLFLSTLPDYVPAGTAPSGRPPSMTLSALEARLHAFLVEGYNRRPHGETGEPPQERWEAGGFLPRLPESLEQLDLLLLTVARSRRVQRDGIAFLGHRYVDPTLAAYVGEDVTIRYDPRDVAEIRVFHQDLFVCRAICPELAGCTVELKDILRARSARRRQLRAGIAEREAIVDAFLLAHREDAEGEDNAAPPAPDEQTPPLDSGPRLKRYRNE